MDATVLVVEDSATQAVALCAVLETRGFRAVRAASAEEALRLLGEHVVDLVLTDIVMPGMSGYELCRHVKASEAHATTPVVLLTSLTDPLDIVRGLECGADNYVTKPYEPDYLCARIRHVLDRQRLRRSPKASLGVNVSFLGTTFSITSDKEQILDQFISSVEEVVRTNAALQESQRALAEAQARLEEYAQGLARQARLSAEKYAVLMMEASDAIAVLDGDGRILEANLRACELFGRSLEGLCGRALDELATPESAGRVREQFARLRRAPRVEEGELRFVHASRGVITCRFSASRTSRDGTEMVLAIMHDITEQRATHERLRRSEALLAQSQRLARLGSWERDVETGVAHWSEQLYEILGLPAAEQAPSIEEFLATVHQDDREFVREGYARALRSGESLGCTFRIVRQSGQVRVVRVHAEVLCGERGRARRVRGTIQDITEHAHLEEQLHQAQKMEAVGQLAGGVAHDFNNLLTVITSYSSMLLADAAVPDATRADVQEIHGAAHRAAALTRQLLAFSRQQVLQPQHVDINSLVAALEKLLRRLVREDIDLETDLERDVGTIWADPGKVEQVIMNLVVNARDAMPDGGRIVIRTRSVPAEGRLSGTEQLAWKPERCVLIEVTDEGTGMTPEVQARAFEPFFTTKEQGKGTGLGLATVYGIVRQSGGEVELDSVVGVGTTVRVCLPCRDEVLGEPATPPAPASAAPSGGETVLVAEDDDALRAVATRVLRRSGYVVLEARNGREALRCCETHDGPIHLVLSDMVMPEMNGYELGRRITEARPLTRLLLMSGYTPDVVIRDGVAPDGSAFLEKPFTPDALAAKVREVLDSATARA